MRDRADGLRMLDGRPRNAIGGVSRREPGGLSDFVDRLPTR